MTKLVRPARPNGIKIESQPTWKQNSIGTWFMVMNANGQEVAVHEDAEEAFWADLTDDQLSPDWAISKSGILYKKEARTNAKPWEF